MEPWESKKTDVHCTDHSWEWSVAPGPAQSWVEDRDRDKVWNRVWTLQSLREWLKAAESPSLKMFKNRLRKRTQGVIHGPIAPASPGSLIKSRAPPKIYEGSLWGWGPGNSV